MILSPETKVNVALAIGKGCQKKRLKQTWWKQVSLLKHHQGLPGCPMFPTSQWLTRSHHPPVSIIWGHSNASKALNLLTLRFCAVNYAWKNADSNLYVFSSFDWWAVIEKIDIYGPYGIRCTAKQQGEAFIEQNMFRFVDWNSKKKTFVTCLFSFLYTVTVLLINNCWDANFKLFH